MKTINLISFFIFILFFSILLVEAGQESIVFEISDPLGDDYGAGNVQYPDNENFYRGMFDITHFAVSKDESNVYFRIKIAKELKNFSDHEAEYQNDLPDDFFLQYIHIYIDTDQVKNSGFLKTIYGCNVQISEDCAWEQAVIVTPLQNHVYREISHKQKELNNRIIIPDDIEFIKNDNTFLVSIPIKEIGEPQSIWGYTVLMMGHDFSSSWRKNIYVREVNSTASQWNFGGGLAKGNDPNVIDLIAPYEHPQEQILKFNRGSENFPTVYAVYGDKSQSNEALIGEVTQVSENKIIVNLGRSKGIKSDNKLLIDDRMIAIVKEVFPEMAIAELNVETKNIEIKVGMKVTIFSVE